MSRPTRSGRTRPCGKAEARKRLGDARKYLDTAELVATERDPESVNVAAGLVVLAGIAASDAACCSALGESSRSSDHRDAAEALRRVEPGGKDAAKDFERLTAIKDQAHCGFVNIARGDLTASLRRAARLVAFAQQTMER